MSKYNKYTFRGLLAGAFIALFATVGGFVFNNKPIVAQSPRDCDSNSIIYGGALTVAELQRSYATGNGNNCGANVHYSDLPTLYSAFGISAQGVASLSTKTALGQVHKDGTVWLNGQKIADNVLTAGRHYKAGSTQVPGTNDWARSPSVSFAASSIDAFIGFENGKPAWAILSACGNPVRWDRPNVSVDKKVAKQDLSAWVEDATYTNNSEVSYLVTVKNSGAAADTNVTVVDRLPAYQTYVAGSTKINNVPNSDGIATTGINIGTLAAGQTTYITFRTKLAAPNSKCGITNMINTVRQDSDKVGPHEDTATTNTNVTCIVVSCNSLNGPDAITLGDTATYSVDASASGTTISGYNFSINGSPLPFSKSNTFSYKPITAGIYTIKATVTFANGLVATGNGKCVKTLTVTQKPQPKVVKCESLDGPAELVVGQSATYTVKTSDDSLVGAYSYSIDGVPVVRGAETATNQIVVNLSTGSHTIKAVIAPKAGVTDGGSANCVRTVIVKEVSTPIYSCDSLDANKTAITLGETVSFTAKATAINTTITEYVFSVNGNPVQSGSTKNTFDFKPTTKGDYTVSVSVKFANGYVKTSDACAKKITVTETVPPCEFNHDLPKDSKDCKPPVEMCPIPGKTQYPKNDTVHCNDVKGATTIPDTGAGSMIGIFTGVTVAGAFMHNMFARRAVRK